MKREIKYELKKVLKKVINIPKSYKVGCKKTHDFKDKWFDSCLSLLLILLSLLFIIITIKLIRHTLELILHNTYLSI